MVEDYGKPIAPDVRRRVEGLLVAAKLAGYDDQTGLIIAIVQDLTGNTIEPDEPPAQFVAGVLVEAREKLADHTRMIKCRHGTWYAKGGYTICRDCGYVELEEE